MLTLTARTRPAPHHATGPRPAPGGRLLLPLPILLLALGIGAALVRTMGAPEHPVPTLPPIQPATRPSPTERLSQAEAEKRAARLYSQLSGVPAAETFSDERRAPAPVAGERAGAAGRAVYLVTCRAEHAAYMFQFDRASGDLLVVSGKVLREGAGNGDLRRLMPREARWYAERWARLLGDPTARMGALRPPTRDSRLFLGVARASAGRSYRVGVRPEDGLLLHFERGDERASGHPYAPSSRCSTRRESSEAVHEKG